MHQYDLKLLALLIGSWLAGLTVYLGALALFYGQSISRGDLLKAGFWSLLGCALAFFVLYLPVLLGVRRLLRGFRPTWLFPFVADCLASSRLRPFAFFMVTAFDRW
jgi:hypothetical protein